MSLIEKGIIFLLCCLPVVALIMVLPKQIKKAKIKSAENQKAKEEQKPAPVAETKPEETAKTTKTSGDDLKDFIDKRKETHKSPVNKMGNLNEFGRYNPNLFRPPVQANKKQDKTIAQQFEELTPEMKAIIMAGVFDKRKFDDDNT